MQCHLLSRSPEIVMCQSGLRSVAHIYSAEKLSLRAQSWGAALCVRSRL